MRSYSKNAACGGPSVRSFTRSFVRFVRSLVRTVVRSLIRCLVQSNTCRGRGAPSHDYSALAFDVCVSLSSCDGFVHVFVLSFFFVSRPVSLVPFHSVNVFGRQRMAVCSCACICSRKSSLSKQRMVGMPPPLSLLMLLPSRLYILQRTAYGCDDHMHENGKNRRRIHI